MLTQIFKSILLMSAVGSVLSAFLLCVKPITRKIFSPRWQYYIWLTVLIVMILPVRFSVPSRTPDIPVVSVNQSKNIETEVPQADSQTADIQTVEQAEKISIPKMELPQNIFYYLANSWLWGMIAILLVKITKYNLFLRAIHKNSVVDTDIRNIPKCLTVRKTDMLDAPLIVGIFKPTLLLPDTEIAENDMNYILMHELTHYRRGDILYKWFAMIVSSIHWFNPFVYVVSGQIDTECEVSCDFAVTKNLSDSEKNNYMSMILDLVADSQSGLRPLTTQMASEKKTIKRRFTMIRNKKSTSKFMSVISALVAVIMLSTTVFASGILTDLTTDDYTIDILNNGEKIELVNKPFIENGEVYVPLRETLEKAMPKDKGIVDIQWDNGTIDVIVAYYQGTSGKYQLKIGGGFVKLQHISYEDYKNNSVENSMIVTALSLKQPPVLKDTITYVTLKDVNYMLYGYTIRRDENNNLYKLDYIVYDKNGDELNSTGVGIGFVGEYEIKIPNWWNDGKYKSYWSDDRTTRYFAQKSSYDKYGAGTLFGISKVEAFAADEYLNMHAGSRLLYKNDEFSYIFIVPTDVQKPIWLGADEEDTEIVKEYDKMYADVYKIADTFEYWGE